jgi:probable O-glycosylation ligase (exosortase A-associated)
LWAWVSYMNPHRLTWGIAYEFPVAAVVGATLLAGVVFTREPRRIPLTPLTAVWILFVLWMCLTTVVALTPEAAHEQLSKVLKFQLIAFITLMLLTTRERLYALIWIIVLSLGFYGIKGGLFALLTGGNYKIWGPEGSFIAGNNEVGLALVMTLPLMRSQRPWVRRALLVAMLLTALTILATYSRGAFLAGGSMAMVLMLKSGRKLA